MNDKLNMRLSAIFINWMLIYPLKIMEKCLERGEHDRQHISWHGYRKRKIFRLMRLRGQKAESLRLF